MTKADKIRDFDTVARERDRFMLAVNDQLNGAICWSHWVKDGSMPIVTAYAAELRKLPLDERWREVAQRKLKYAVTRPNADSGEYAAREWEKVRNEMAERYSAMLGVPNPVMAEIADALGLTAEKQEERTQPDIDISAFGV